MSQVPGEHHPWKAIYILDGASSFPMIIYDDYPDSSLGNTTAFGPLVRRRDLVEEKDRGHYSCTKEMVVINPTTPLDR